MSNEEQGFFDLFPIRAKEAWDKSKELTKRMIAALKVRYAAFKAGLKRLNALQVLVALIISTIGIYLASVRFINDPSNFSIMLGMIFAGVIIGSWTWLKFTRRFFGRFIYFIAEQKYTRKIIAGGSFSYYEYKDPKSETLKSNFTEPIGIVITTLITLLGLATTIIGILRGYFDDLQVDSAILWGGLAILAPLLATPVIPMIWALEDAKIKSWNSNKNTTWMVSGRYKARFNSVISIGAIYANLKEGITVGGIIGQLEILWGILSLGAIIMFILIGFFIIFYYAWYRDYLRIMTLSSLSIPCYQTSFIEKDVTQFEAEKEETQKQTETNDTVGETEHIEPVIEADEKGEQEKQETNSEEYSHSDKGNED